MGTLPLTLIRPGLTSALGAPAQTLGFIQEDQGVFSFTTFENNPLNLREDTFNLFYSVRRHSYW